MNGGKLTWKYPLFPNIGNSTDPMSGDYTFSLRNHLRTNVRNVYCFVIFYDPQGDPIEVDVVFLRDPIPAGLAKRVASEVDESVQELTTRVKSKTPYTKVEFRILDFEIME